MKFFAAALVAASLSLSHAAEKTWARLTGCQWMENESNDGDSFHVKYQGREFIFRLYFVDACESSQQVPERVKEQAKFLGITTDQVIAAGIAAKEMTRKYLAGETFTVLTQWEDARGASRLPRNYAFVLFGKDDEHDVASTLIQNGLGRIYGMPADPPGPVTAAEFQNSLRKLDDAARAQHVGIFGNLDASTSAAGANVAGGTKPAAPRTGSSSPLSYLMPAHSHPPDVVDNPADDVLSDFSIKAATAPQVIQSTIPEDDFSEVPGWKPRPKPKPESTPAPAK